VVFGPVCPTWVRDAHEGIFTDQAVAYYEERARTGLGMIILGGQIIEKDTIYTPAAFPGLWHDDQIEGIAKVARAVQKARLRDNSPAPARGAAVTYAVPQDRPRT
jgi:2,4-dienoyl-CoA reductase-like NADH-dependent reductase (Old Yellow Enzyme family)